jgi:hypothetical protein
MYAADGFRNYNRTFQGKVRYGTEWPDGIVERTKPSAARSVLGAHRSLFYHMKSIIKNETSHESYFPLATSLK